ncbi:murein L,D-transpeptidase family protein [Rhizobium sp. RU36D]|uniref:L,D-transpeptidase family protein n=1 Tax=Rhizobium sp. RU36D TaxID=1907415 RepID=UPI0009D7FCDD|nr:murein L,D-transpeptidase family protein [Rhizobium sp. RU36D]SMC77578.1 Murein L,D-transpeptidase YafK [Rhizobium sp. RU36D]
MRLTSAAVLFLAAAVLVGCNDTMDEAFDPKTIANKVEHPLPPRILQQMKAKGMDRNSPIAIRIFKEEGVLEVWKAKTDNRFEKITEYQICAWSGRLGPKVKEGDRQAPEGFYPLSPAHLNPYSKYYLAINTGFPNRFDQANSRTGSNLMIHGACSSSGCYSMTDGQMLEIYAFARDAFKGGQKTIQLQAFPFRMTAENMARHQHSPHFEFWKMLKVGYDNFEVTKRPPDVNVCERKYVFNQSVEGNASFNAGAACPPMSTPPALASALKTYEVAYARDFEKAAKKYDGKIWYDPTEAERKALVANQRKGRDLAYAPTGSALKAGRFLDIETATAQNSQQALMSVAPSLSTASGRPAAAAAQSQPVAPQSQPVATPAQPAPQVAAAAGSTPIPTPDPREQAQVAPSAEAKKPFWKIW